MKKYLKNFALIWLVGVILFSVIVFAVGMASDPKPTVAYYILYVFVLLAFAGQMGLAYKFFNVENKEKVFLQMPLLTIGKTCVVVSAILGTVLMVVPAVPHWLAAAVGFAILGFFAIAVIKADTAAQAAEEIEKKVDAQTAFIKDMTLQAQNVCSSAKTEKGKAIAEKVYDAFRYSDKSSHGDFSTAEDKISANFSVFADAVATGDDELSEKVGEQLICLVQERNNIAKAVK